MKSKPGERTLLASVILSTPGAVVVGVGYVFGRSSTQFADFVRRAAELVAIVVSWIIFRVTNSDGVEDAAKKAKLECVANLCVGAAMCLSGIIMFFIAILSQSGESGNVVPGLVIAILGVIVNSWFWLRYRRLNKIAPNIILGVQSRLYRAKSFVDVCVAAALAAIVVAPASSAAVFMDIAGSAVVSVYLFVTGVTTIFGKRDVLV